MRIRFTIAAVLLVAVSVGFSSVSNATTFLTFGGQEVHTYNDIPFRQWGVWVLVEKTDSSFVPSQTIDLCGRVADKIHILEGAWQADNVPDGVVVGHINVYYADGTLETVDLVMGVNIAESTYDNPELQPYLQHTKIPPAYSWLIDENTNEPYLGHYFYVSVETERKVLDYLELVLDPASYTDQEFYGGSPADWFRIHINAITLEGVLTVDAGNYECITWPEDTINLDGTVATSPDGATFTTVWSKVSGPGEVTFGDADAEDTTATFSEAGVYVLRLTSDDGVESIYDEVRGRVREEGTVDIGVVNHSFEYYADGSQIFCHTEFGPTNPGALMGWTGTKDFVGVDVYCGAEGVCDDCRRPVVLDGIAHCFMESNDTEVYQVLEHTIGENRRYTLTFNGLAPWHYGMDLIASLFYVDDGGEHVELVSEVINLTGELPLCTVPKWVTGVMLTLMTDGSEDYIGKPLGVKFSCPIPEEGVPKGWAFIDNVRIDFVSAEEPTCPAKTYTLDADFDEGELVGLEHDSVCDQLQISTEPTTLPYMWVPNNDGTVSKVDTETGDELGRYMVAPHSDCSPSRTTVATDGSCWVGNRQAGTVVKIGLYEAGHWIDRNGDGVCQTSRDINGDGVITPNPDAGSGPWSLFDNVRLDWTYDGQVEAVDVVNPSFEYYEDGSQILCHMTIGYPETIMGWTNIGDWAGVDVDCGAEGVCEDCRPWSATDGIAYSFIELPGVELYQVLNDNIVAGREYTFTVDQINWGGGSFALVFFYPKDDEYPDENHVEICRQTYAGIHNEWMNDVTVTFTAEAGATYIGKPLGIKLTAADMEPEVLPWGEDECVLYEVSLIPGKEGTYEPGTVPETLPVWLPNDGQIDGAIELNGTNHVELPALNLNSNTVTISAWIKRDGEQASSYTGIVYSRDGSTIAGLSFGGSGPDAEPPWQITNELAYNWNEDQSAWDFQSGLIIPDNKWVFVAVVVEPTQATLYLYDKNTLSSATNLLDHDIEEFDGVTLIGSDTSGWNRHFKGMIDDVAIFNRALSEAEIIQLYSQGGGSFISNSDLAGLWELDEAEGDIASDSSANGNDGTLIAGPDYDYNNWGTAPRGLAIDAYNNLWAGTSSTKQYYYIDGKSGEILKRIDVSMWNHDAYGAVTDKYGVVWSSAYSGQDIWIDPSTELPTIGNWNPGHFVYGIGLDYLGNLFGTAYVDWLSKVDVFSRVKVWTQYKPEIDGGRGVMCTRDNDVWVACTDINSVHRYDNNGNRKATIPVGSGPTGLSVDAAGKVWVCDLKDEYIHRIDPGTNTIDLSKSIMCSGGHYTYSDMTGMVSRTITTKTGTWTVIYDSDVEDSPWGMVSWNGDEPDGTSITVRVSSSNDQVHWSPCETARNGVGLSETPDGRYLRIKTELKIISGEVSPVLYDLTVVLGEDLPVADAGGPYIVKAMDWLELLELNGTGSYDPCGYVLAYRWDLDLSADSDGDGNPENDDDATGATPEALFPIGQTEISLIVLDECGWWSSPVVSTVTVSVIEVGVEIRIDDGNDTINVNSEGVVRVAFLTDLPEFDALVVDPNTVTLRGEDFEGFVQLRSKNEAVPMVVDQDFDGDGDIDRVVNLDTERLTAEGLDAYCEIGALTYDGYVVLGVDIAHLAPVSEPNSP